MENEEKMKNLSSKIGRTSVCKENKSEEDEGFFRDFYEELGIPLIIAGGMGAVTTLTVLSMFYFGVSIQLNEWNPRKWEQASKEKISQQKQIEKIIEKDPIKQNSAYNQDTTYTFYDRRGIK